MLSSGLYPGLKGLAALPVYAVAAHRHNAFILIPPLEATLFAPWSFLWRPWELSEHLALQDESDNDGKDQLFGCFCEDDAHILLQKVS